MVPVPGGSDVASITQTLRVLQRQATSLGVVSPTEAGPRANATGELRPTQGFQAQLREAIDSVNALQKDSAAMADGFVRGDHRDLVGTMVASQKAQVAFQATLATRNRLVSAYQDIMNMPI